MLPLLQLHPHAVPAANILDPLSALPYHEDYAADQHSHLRPAQTSHQRSFPIRSSRPHLRTAVSSASSFPLQSEHHLRRKTPNGTIDAGYDGSPSQSFQGPPPVKHTILPACTTGTPQFVQVSQLRYQARQVIPPSYHHALRSPYGGDASDFGTARWLFNPALQCMPTFDSSSTFQGYPTSFFTCACQPFVRPSEYNVRAFCPPPGTINESLPFGPHSWQPGTSTWEVGSLGRSHILPTTPFQTTFAGIAPYPALHPSSGDVFPNIYGKSQHAKSSVNGMRSSNVAGDLSVRLSTPNTSLEFDNHTLSNSGQATFSERALFQAHRSYIDVLAYFQGNKRRAQGKDTLGNRSPSHLVYPKPPKPSRAAPLLLSDNASVRFAGPNKVDHVTDHEVSSAYRLSSGNHVYMLAGHRHNVSANHGHQNSSLELDNRRQFHPHSVAASYHADLAAVSIATAHDKSPPLTRCRASLDVIHSLCEQSGWKWVDGMLVGGCLHYALEQYEDALKWFLRITALEPSHAEAITNTAAALYSLGRQDEAEQTWLNVVKLHPDYLEAAEHLVGLMYKKRSNEAIEVVNYIQRALRLPGSEPSSANPFVVSAYADDRRRTPHGFGTSGYAIQGSENGRILALIHAKGTMLYSLKKTQQASEAFEEAVMISIGRRMKGVQELIRHIQTVLSKGKSGSDSTPHVMNSLRPLLLPPEKARHTAQLAFASGEVLPGLLFMPDGPARRAAVQTTSNSLLSLAKILQDAVSIGSSDSSLFRQPSGVGDILALYYLSLSLQESPSTANNVGILLAGVQQTAPYSAQVSGDTVVQPTIPGIAPGSGLALALSYYHYGLRLDPKHVHLHTNLGSLLKDIGQLDLAIQMYERAVSCDETFDIALTNLANAVKDKGRIADAISYYRRAVASNPDFAEAVCGLLTALNSVCDWRGRGGVLLQSGQYDRWHVDQGGMLVDVLDDKRGRGLTQRVADIVRLQLDEASHWGCSTLRGDVISFIAQQLQHCCEESSFELDEALRHWAGQPWEGSRLLRLVERASRVLLRRSYVDQYVTGKRGNASYRRPRLPALLAVPSAPTVLPFHTFTTPLTPRDIRTISQRNALRISCSTLRSPWLSQTVYPPPPPPNPNLNVGYVSSDFNNHPLAHLMQSVFGIHNRRRVRAVCYATTASDKSSYRQQIEREAPVFRDVSSWAPNRVVEQIIKDEIHVLVNLNGYTRGARNEIFAARPAPVQMSFMGFAGTLGAEWCDYILADRIAVPVSTLRPWRDNVRVEDLFHDATEGDGSDWMYSENVIFCRDTFFCCDHAQSCDSSERSITWMDEEERRWAMRRKIFPSLSDDTVILGNFNQLYKIEPTTFRSWLRILARVPKAVLWLLRFPELGERNLRRSAEVWAGVEVASRLIFTDVAPKSQHISRARVCDLFLDTPECNAHTTAADVLWSSTPLLTFPRYPYKMCSRMAASILTGALPKTIEGRQAAKELIVHGETGYEHSAISLAGGLSYDIGEKGYGSGKGRLAEIRKLLWDHRWSCGLFDTRRWVDDVETAYEEAWRRWVAGEGGDIYL